MASVASSCDWRSVLLGSSRVNAVLPETWVSRTSLTVPSPTLRRRAWPVPWVSMATGSSVRVPSRVSDSLPSPSGTTSSTSPKRFDNVLRLH